MNTKQMKTNALYLLAWCCMLCSLPVSASKPDHYDYQKERKVVESFRVGSNDLVQIDNRYGSITVTHWSKNEVEIQVKIKTKANDHAVAQEALDRVHIELKKEGNVVSGVTTLKSQNNWSGNSNQSLTIDYYVSMPATLTSDLTQKYGNINLPEQNDGRCSVHIKYGNLNAGNFSRKFDLEAKYGNVDLGNLAEAELELGYIGTLTCKDGNELTINSKYSKVKMGKVHRLDLEEKYGNLSIASLDRGSIGLKYSDGTIGFLKEQLDVDDLSYGSLTIEEVSASFKQIHVEARYGNLSLRIPKSTAFTLEAEDMRYGKYKVEGFSITSDERDGKTNYRSEINGGSTRHIYFGGNNYSNLTIKAF